MMKKSCFILVMVCLSFLFVSAASAEMYGSAKMGYVMTTDSDVTAVTTAGTGTGSIEWDAGFGFTVAIGAAMENFRVEGEFAYRTIEPDNITAGNTTVNLSGDLDVVSLMANGYYDFATGSVLTPYVGAGLGIATIDDSDVDDTVFAYQAMIGANVALSETVDMDFSYQYFATADPEFDTDNGTLEAEYGSHNLFAGLRFKF